ncbi:MAG: hypothetical protein ACYTBX_05320 [Planctomycetota bacterium]|jgi:hypothetical protein
MGGQFGSEEPEQEWIQMVPKDNEDDDDAHEDDLPNAGDPVKEAIYYINNMPIAP